MITYVYMCEHCGRTFEVQVAEGAEAPAEHACPHCEYPHGTLAFRMPGSNTCAPGSGC